MIKYFKRCGTRSECPSFMMQTPRRWGRSMGRFWGTYKPELLFLFDIFTHDHLLTPPSPSVYIIADQPCLLFKMLPPPLGGLCVSAVVGCLVGLHEATMLMNQKCFSTFLWGVGFGSCLLKNISGLSLHLQTAPGLPFFQRTPTTAGTETADHPHADVRPPSLPIFLFPLHS